MPLDPYLAARAVALRAAGDIWADPSDPVAVAALQEWNVDPAPWAVPGDVTVSDLTVDGPAGPIPVRVYQGHPEPAGTLVWSHGGGFSFGDLDMFEAQIPSAELCARAGWRVVSVDYRLATGGVRFPVPLDDVFAVWLWAATLFGADAPLAIGGASAGATLSLSVALRARDTKIAGPDVILLAYPFAHFPPAAASDELAAELAALPAAVRVKPAFLEEIVHNYVGRISDLPALAAPGGADLAGLPPVRIIVSELDDLRASGELLARQITEADGGADVYLARGMVHGHLDRRPSLPEVDRSLEYFAEALRTTGSARYQTR